MAKGAINTVIDQQSVQAQFDWIEKQLNDLKNTLQGIKPISLGFDNSGNLKNLIDNQKQLASSYKDITGIQQQIVSSSQKLAASYTDEAKQLTANKLALQEQNSALKDSVKLDQAKEGSINQLRIQLKAAQKDYDALSQAERDSAQGQDLLKKVQSLDTALKALEGSTGRFQRNVGDYKGAAATIVAALQEVENKINDLKEKQQSLQNLSTRNQIGFKTGGGQDNLNQTSAQLKTLQDEANALNQIVGDPKFLTIANAGETRSQIGFLTNSLVDLEKEGLRNTDAYKLIQSELAKTQHQLTETRAEVKALGSQSRSIDLFASSVTFLARTYETAVAATNLFGSENENAAKAIQKLVAIQSLANGVQEIAKQLTERSSAAGKAYAFVQQQIAVITDVSTSATQKFNAALKLSGIGLLITGIGILISKISDLGDSTKKTDLIIQEFNNELERTNRILNNNVKDIEFSTNLSVEKAKQRGATEKEISDIIITGYRNEAEASRNAAQEKIKNATDAAKKAFPGTPIPTFDIKTTKDAQSLLDFLENLKTKVDNFDGAKKNIKDLAASAVDASKDVLSSFQQAEDIDRKASELQAQQKTKSFQDFLQITLEQKRLEVATNKAKNDEILNNDQSSSEAKIAALKRNYDQENRLIESQRVRSKLSGNAVEVSLADNVANAAKIQAQTKLNEDIFKINEDFRKRDLAAQKNIISAQLQLDQKKYEQIANDQNKSYSDRIAALSQIFNDQKAQLLADQNFELQTSSLTAKERTALEISTNTAIEQARIEFVQKLKQLNEQSFEQRGQNDQSQIEKQKNEALKALAEQFGAGKILQQKYDQERLKIENDYNLESLQQQLNHQKNLLFNLEQQGANTIDVEKKIADTELKIQDAKNQKKIQKEKDTAKKIGEISKEVANGLQTISDLFTAISEGKKQDLDNQLQAIDDRKNKELSALDQLSLSEKEKAKREKQINDQAAAETEKINKRKQQINVQEAKFQKAAQIAKIIGDTASAIAEALPNIPLSIIVGALGAVQLATVIATPIPQYKKGVKSSPEGPAIIAEAGRELIKTPEGNITLYDKPAMTWLPKGTTVFNNNDTEMMLRMSVEGMKNTQKLSEQLLVNDNRKAIEQNEKIVVQNQKILNELKELNQKSRIIIQNKMPIETTAWYQRNIK